ncbi:hypothetical protein GA0074695_0598 [Micromonospora viridifaciens]|uniref:Uncharacterized protein n=1 Tax=Micromonospora viridifaciens TaxID=1881 RepID=A0A1C4UKU0_MICVI|nr:DUF6114 domain-containing protein [Micromonospora viridifaciens]SCE72289.1 hypothetical protein GA0074695_0598 [Micromonospora viridifaciens]
MTTAETQHAQPGRFGQAWRGFRQWRRTRPFWGGVFTALAGLEIFGSTQMSLNGLTFKMGPTGFLTWLIPAILVTCGMLLWFSPQQRIFYSVVAAVTAVYSLIGVNLGGFFIGLLLGMVGSALGFAWVPVRKTRPAEEPVAGDGAPDGDTTAGGDEELALVDELLPRQREEESTGVLTDTLPEPRNPLREVAPAEPPAADPDPPHGYGHRDPKLYAILLVLATVSMAGLLAFRGEEVALAAPAGCPIPGSSAPSPSGSDSDPGADSDSASASPSPREKSSDGNLLTDLVDGITGLFRRGQSDDAGTQPSPTPSSRTAPAVVAAEPTATGTRTAGTTPTSAAPKPSSSSSAKRTAPGKPCASPAPTRPQLVEVGKPLPRLAADPDQPRVAAKPAKLTGSRVTMIGLRFAGIVELPTGDGPLKCLKFTMDTGVTDDFVLQADGPAGRILRYVSDQLTVDGDVAFYATRFSARLAGHRFTLTPDLPFPDGIPITSPVPVSFTDPEIDLAYVDSNTLTAKPVLKIDLG